MHLFLICFYTSSRKMLSCGGHPCIWQPVPQLSSSPTLPCVLWRPSRSESRHSLGGPQHSERDSPEFLKRRELMGKSMKALKRLFLFSSQFFKNWCERKAFRIIFCTCCVGPYLCKHILFLFGQSNILHQKV